MANRMLMVTIVRPMAISGETSAMMFDRSARFSSTNCMRCFLLLQAASTHQQAKLFAGGVRRRHRLREVAMEHHSDTVGDFGEFVEILAGHEHRRPVGGKGEQRLPEAGSRPRVHAPGGLADDENRWVTKDFAADNEFLQIAAGQ